VSEDPLPFLSTAGCWADFVNVGSTGDVFISCLERDFLGATDCFFALGPSVVEPDSLFRFPFTGVEVSTFRLLLSSFRLLLISPEGTDLELSSIFDLDSPFLSKMSTGFGPDLFAVTLLRGNFVTVSSDLTLWINILEGKLLLFGAVTLGAGVGTFSAIFVSPYSDFC